MGKPRIEYNRFDLLNELNRIKRQIYGENFQPITMEQIYIYCNPKNVEVRRYRTFKIKKRHGGTRDISAPYRTLHSIQRCLNEYFKEIYTPSESAMGFAPGRSVVDNARIHVGHNYVFNMDLRNFFPSIPEGRLIARLQLPPFNFNKTIAQVIGGLCAIRMVDENGKESFVLPQGAPTSPLLTNAICDVLDKKLRKLAYKHGLHYSRYADDLTFSSMHNKFQKDSDFRKEVNEIIIEQGFTINDDKTRLQKRGSRQEVTGLVVNHKANVARQYVRDVRNILHIWEKYGYGDAYARFYIKYKETKGYIKKGEPILENVIDGKLNYLKMVKGEKDSVYQNLYTRYMNLSPCLYSDKETDKGKKYVFVQSYTISEFEEKFNTKIELRNTEKQGLIGHCEIYDKEKYLSINKDTQAWLISNGNQILNEEGQGYLVSIFFPLCYITLCRQSGMNFWLITQGLPAKTTILRWGKNVPTDELIRIWEDKGIEEASEFLRMYCTGQLKMEDSPKFYSLFQEKGIGRTISDNPDSLYDEFDETILQFDQDILSDD